MMRRQAAVALVVSEPPGSDGVVSVGRQIQSRYGLSGGLQPRATRMVGSTSRSESSQSTLSSSVAVSQRRRS